MFGRERGGAGCPGEGMAAVPDHRRDGEEVRRLALFRIGKDVARHVDDISLGCDLESGEVVLSGNRTEHEEHEREHGRHDRSQPPAHPVVHSLSTPPLAQRDLSAGASRVPPHTLLWSPAASSSQQRARVLAGVKARRFAPPPLCGADGPDTGLVQAGSCWRCPLLRPLHVVVDVLSRMRRFPATVDNGTSTTSGKPRELRKPEGVAAWETADDATGRNSPSTKALLDHLEQPLEILTSSGKRGHRCWPRPNGQQRQDEYWSLRWDQANIVQLEVAQLRPVGSGETRGPTELGSWATDALEPHSAWR